MDRRNDFMDQKSLVNKYVKESIMELFDLTGKKAIVTGAARGLGYGIAKGLYEAGADIVLVDLSAAVADSAAQLSGKGSAYAIQCNITDWEALPVKFNEAVEKLGTVDILVNAAGITIRKPAEEFTDDDWDNVLNVNLKAAFKLCQMAGRIMLENRKGKIVNIASMNSFFGGYYIVSYTASKGGINQMTKALSNEWAEYGINVNAIAPGYMLTPLNAYYQETEEGRKLQEIICSRIPAKRWGKPEDLVGTAVYLSSAASDYVNGITIPVDGGYLGR